MQNIKSPMATPTYRRRRAKREFWNTTKAYANYELRNPSAVSTAKTARKKSAVKSVNDWISQMGEVPVRVQSFTESKVRFV